MSEKKEEKKGSWGTLFAPRKSSCCSCGSVIEGVSEDENKKGKDRVKTDKDKDGGSCCGK